MNEVQLENTRQCVAWFETTGKQLSALSTAAAVSSPLGAVFGYYFGFAWLTLTAALLLTSFWLEGIAKRRLRAARSMRQAWEKLEKSGCLTFENLRATVAATTGPASGRGHARLLLLGAAVLVGAGFAHLKGPSSTAPDGRRDRPADVRVPGGGSGEGSTPAAAFAQSKAQELAERIKRGDDEGVIAALDGVIAAEPRSAGAHALRALYLFGVGRLKDAALGADRAIQIGPSDPNVGFAFFVRGMLRLEGRLDDEGRRAALADFARAIELNETGAVSATAHLMAGVLNLGLGRSDEGSRHLAAAREMNPNLPGLKKWGEGLTTLRYWVELHRVLGATMEGTPGQPTFEGRVSLLRTGSAAIYSLRTEGVDEDAVRVGVGLAAHLENVGNTAVYVNDPSLLLQALVRGVNGDPFGTAKDVQDSSDAVEREARAVTRSLKDWAAILTARYNVPFP